MLLECEVLVQQIHNVPTDPRPMSPAGKRVLEAIVICRDGDFKKGGQEECRPTYVTVCSRR